ncbi:hypothetical protein [Dyadobacter sp.]|uniref:hypothetical protein n=1 Tax=Dyadobacter sp. TaxID=1914288 RepID=UPI003F6E57D0
MKSLRKLHFPAMLAVIFLGCLMDSCFLKQDRTTVVYGTITDEKGQAVDSIMVICQGKRMLTYELLATTYSDKNGKYELLIDVPKKFVAINAGIPSFPVENPKFHRKYVSYGVLKNGKVTTDCCNSDVGTKTQYDFQLKSR